ncbi:unnamed protein product [Gongylonema pulchrum]|uniref:P-type domain-containing protein n=1 Tax=Gongylonema pulchrum TaxID=637853 RepID=A0A183E125_9BILA|nr:unnamed protein product [Gongylonema pulchrum]
MTSKESKDVEAGTKASEASDFQISDLQKCGKYIYYLTLVYFIMVLTQVCNLLFMTFADRKPTVKDVCEKNYHDYIGSKACNKTNCWVTTNETGKTVCSSRTYDFIPIRNDVRFTLK